MAHFEPSIVRLYAVTPIYNKPEKLTRPSFVTRGLPPIETTQATCYWLADALFCGAISSINFLISSLALLNTPQKLNMELGLGANTAFS